MRLPAPDPCALWRVRLDQPPSTEGLAMLSDDEWARARRFAFRRDRDRYTAAHAALREVLGHHVGTPGAALDLVEGPFGKPALGGANAGAMSFNLSHSGDVALIALCPDGDLGVDIEVPRPLPDAQALAQAHFTAAECSALALLPVDRRERAFLSCWTRKEACVKAIGLGLSVDTRTFEVGIEPDARTVCLPADGLFHHLSLWSFSDDSGMLAAVARATAPRGCAARRAAQETESCT